MANNKSVSVCNLDIEKVKKSLSNFVNLDEDIMEIYDDIFEIRKDD